MSKKKENKNKELVVNEPVIVDENAVITGEDVNSDEVMDVTAPEVIMNSEGADEPEEDSNEDVNSDDEKVDDEPEEEVSLKIERNFTDKYNSSVKYVKGEIHLFEIKRAKELLNDKRNLVSEVK